jgi:hypothetical protein
MILRKDAKTLVLAVALFAQLEQANVEGRADLLDLEILLVKKEQAQAIDNPAVGYRAEAQAMAQYKGMEMVTLPHGAVWENSYPDTVMTVSLEKMETEKKGLERLAHELEGTEQVLEDFKEEPGHERESLEEQARAYAGIKADAELAAAAIEQATVELENERSEQQGKAEQETTALEEKFTAERDDLVGKLDKMRDKYFENYPDLDQDQRTDAEGTFKTIKDDAVEALKADQGTRLAEREAMHQGLQESYEQRRKELEGTRARDDRD